MAIKRTVNPDGSWREEADTKESARDLFEKHKPALQKRGEDAFQKGWLRDNAIGAERLIGPQGTPEFVRADEVDRSLSSGFSPMNRPRTVVGDLPWPKAYQTPGRHKYKYNRETGTMEEI